MPEEIANAQFTILDQTAKRLDTKDSVVQNAQANDLVQVTTIVYSVIRIQRRMKEGIVDVLIAGMGMRAISILGNARIYVCLVQAQILQNVLRVRLTRSSAKTIIAIV